MICDDTQGGSLKPRCHSEASDCLKEKHLCDDLGFPSKNAFSLHTTSLEKNDCKTMVFRPEWLPANSSKINEARLSRQEKQLTVFAASDKFKFLIDN